MNRRPNAANALGEEVENFTYVSVGVPSFTGSLANGASVSVQVTGQGADLMAQYLRPLQWCIRRGTAVAIRVATGLDPMALSTIWPPTTVMVVPDDPDFTFLATMPWAHSALPHLPLRYRRERYRMALPPLHLPELTPNDQAMLARALIARS
jgi:hypothetical protein